MSCKHAPYICEVCGFDIGEDGICDECGFDTLFELTDDDYSFFTPSDEEIATLGEDGSE